MRIVKEQRKDGTQYLARPIIDGKKLAVRANTKGELERMVAALKEKQHRRRLGIEESEAVRRPDITLNALADLFLDGYPHSPRSKRSLEERLKYSRRAFGTVNVRELRPETIAAWNRKLKVGPTTRGNALKALRRICAVGADWGYLTTNPVTTKAPAPGRRVKQPFEAWKEVDNVAAKAGDYSALIRFVCATGLRPQEWRALEWGDVDLDAGLLHVRRTVQEGVIVNGSAKTEGSLRTVQLQKRAIDAIKSLPRPIRGGLIFSAPDGGLIHESNFRRRVWTKALTAAGLEYRAHDQMRHTFATLALTAGAELAWVHEQLGHAHLQTTIKHYAKWLPAAHERNLSILNAFAAKAPRTGLKADSLPTDDRQS